MANETTLFTPGRTIMLASNLFYSIGAFLADFNVTHVYNPRWPPHARFHNGQTMTLGVMLASFSIYQAFSPYFQRKEIRPEQARERMLWSAIVGSMYCASACSAILYPGTAWKDSEIAVGGGQKWPFTGQVVLVWVAYWLESSRLKVKEA
ncbi:hypothetical protein EJ03DRAFT_328942 [Teratosphaeria nubilosa]|uniref:Uncharacterized protein n=1 Tax=Teratosphaeria nubilosa TaxID=161662 RepID=A0A6G1L4J5_9PEZI|nr:hypothetical protein EJ03DRAFT_328942 [Teratosphaeria nubilosa]